MKVWKSILLIVALGATLWVLSPQRTILRKAAGTLRDK
jgi:hypothetical protein